MNDQPGEVGLPMTGANPSAGSEQPPPPGFGRDHTPFDALGGDGRVRALVWTFFEQLDSDDEYAAARTVYPDDLTGPRQRLYEFLSGWLGGPPLYTQQYGHPRLRMRHAKFPIGISQRDQWLACMGAAMDKLSVDGELRAFLDARFAQVADFMRNS